MSNRTVSSHSIILAKYILFSLSILLILFFLFSIRFPFVNKAVAEEKIEIHTLQDLDAIRNNLTASYILMNDLDFNDDTSYNQLDTDWQTKKTAWTTGEGWVPLGSEGLEYKGIFNGQGNVISNVFINRPTSYNIGLFGYLLNGQILNLGVENVNITGERAVGGLLGYNSGKVIGCYSTGTIVGGLSQDSWTSVSTGGLVGHSLWGYIAESYSSASVTGYQYTGGLIGNLYNSTLINSYSTGAVFGTGNPKGGLIGYNVNSSQTNSFWDTQTSGVATSPLGTGKTTLQMKALSTFQGLWNIVDISNPNKYIWYIDNGNDYPKLVSNITPGSYLDSDGDYFLIWDVDDLKIVKEYSTIAGFKYKVMDDIDLSGDVGFYIPSFLGEFDGNGFEISNLTINTPGGNYLGLFGKLITGAVVSNLGVVNVNITGASYSYIGGITGENNGTITNSYVTGTISGSSYIGGISGNNNGIISNSYMTGTISGTSYVGGLSGYNKKTISNSYVKNFSVTGSSSVGPIIGESYDYYIPSYSATETNCFYDYETTTINGQNSFILGALDPLVFNNWISDNFTLDLSRYFDKEGEYYLIKNLGEFKILRNFGFDSTLKVKLTVNLDMTSIPGYYIPFFEGEFDGNGYEVSNLVLDIPVQFGVGLFGYGVNSVIKNLGVVDADVTGDNCVGGISGTAGYVYNSYVTGSVNSADTTKVDALIGCSSPGEIINSFYNYDNTTINGTTKFSLTTLENEVFNDWVANERVFDLTQYFPFDGGYYLIDSPDDLKILRSLGWNSSLKVKIINDIDLIAHPNLYLPFFSGEFNGNGKKILNLSINMQDEDRIGLIGELVKGGKVTNLGLTNVDIAADSYVGGLVGYNNGSIYSSYSEGLVSGESLTGLNSYIGGLVGYNKDGGVYGSYTTGTVSGTSTVGSLVGYNTINGSIIYSYSSANSTATGSNVGGLVGENNNGKLKYSFSTGTVGGNSNVGGLVGHNYGEVSNTYSESSVSGSSYIGGLVGRNESSGKIDSSYSKGTVTGTSYKGGLYYGIGTATNSFWDTATSGMATSSGGTGKSTSEMKSLSTYLNTATVGLSVPWNILDSSDTGASIWDIDDSNSYPKLNGIASNPGDYFDKDGDYYLIYDLEDLKWFAYNFSYYSLYKFKLAADIDLATVPNFYIPLFSGELNGNGKKVLNLKLSDVSPQKVGLFGELSLGAIINNLGVVDIDITGSSEYIGGIVGYNYGSITNSYTTGIIDGSAESVGGIIGFNMEGKLSGSHSTVTIRGSYAVGGLIGWSEDGEIKDSYWEGTLEGGDYAGGLIGFNEGGGINNCYTKGVVNSTGDVIGGLIGYHTSSMEEIEGSGIVQSSYSEATVTGSYEVGGLLGMIEGDLTSILKSYATGAVTGRYYVGGLVGETGDNCTIGTSFATGNVTGDDEVGGLIGENDCLSITNSYSLGKVTETSGDGYEIGGLIGYHYGGIINNCYSAGEISSLLIKEGDVGGLIGYNRGENDAITNSFWDTDTSTLATSSGGTGKPTSEMKSISTYNNTVTTDGLDTSWDITSIESFVPTSPRTWYIDNSNDYPHLFFENPNYIPGTEPGEVVEETPEEEPVITTNVPTNITTNSATLNAYLGNLGTFTPVYVYFRYKATGESVWVESSKVAQSIVDFFSLNLMNFTPNTSYEYTSAVDFGNERYKYGDILSFTTQNLSVESPVQEPEVEQPPVLEPKVEKPPVQEPEIEQPPMQEPEVEESPVEEPVATPEESPEKNEENPGDKKKSIFTKISNFTEKAVKSISEVKIDKTTVDTLGTIGIAAATTTHLILNFVTFTGRNSISTLQLLSSFFVIGALKKKKQKFGIVYDSITKEPINLAIVRVFDINGKLTNTVVTDVYGIFDLNMEQGQYRFEVETKGYVFPSNAVLGTYDQPYQNVYKGGLINYIPNQPINISIPLDKQDKDLIAKTFASGKSLMISILNLVVSMLFILGFAMTALSLIKEPTTLSWILLALYIFSILILIYLRTKEIGSYGRITTPDGIPVEGFEIGLRELEFDTLYAKRITNKEGKYRFILPKGRYKLESLNNQYIFVNLQEDIFQISEGKLFIMGQDLVVKRV